MSVLTSLRTFVARATRITADWLNKVDGTLIGTCPPGAARRRD